MVRLQLPCLVDYNQVGKTSERHSDRPMGVSLHYLKGKPLYLPYGSSPVGRTEQQSNQCLASGKAWLETGWPSKCCSRLPNPVFATGGKLLTTDRPAFPPCSSPTAASSQSISECSRRPSLLRPPVEIPFCPQTQQSRLSFKPSQLIALSRTRANTSTARVRLAVPLCPSPGALAH